MQASKPITLSQALELLNQHGALAYSTDGRIYANTQYYREEENGDYALYSRWETIESTEEAIEEWMFKQDERDMFPAGY